MSAIFCQLQPKKYLPRVLFSNILKAENILYIAILDLSKDINSTEIFIEEVVSLMFLKIESTDIRTHDLL